MIQRIIDKIKEEPEDSALDAFIDMTIFGIGLGFMLGTVLLCVVNILN